MDEPVAKSTDQYAIRGVRGKKCQKCPCSRHYKFALVGKRARKEGRCCVCSALNTPPHILEISFIIYEVTRRCPQIRKQIEIEEFLSGLLITSWL